MAGNGYDALSPGPGKKKQAPKTAFTNCFERQCIIIEAGNERQSSLQGYPFPILPLTGILDFAVKFCRVLSKKLGQQWVKQLASSFSDFS